MIRTARGQSERGGPAFGLDRSLEDAKQPAYSVEPIKHLSSAVSGPQFRTASKKRGGLGRRDRKARARCRAEVPREPRSASRCLPGGADPSTCQASQRLEAAGVRVGSEADESIGEEWPGRSLKKIAPAISRLVYHVGSISPRACWFDRLKQTGLDI